MTHENNQHEIQQRQLRPAKTQKSPGLWTDIGEAQIIETIFGRAKVRVIHQHSKTRNASLLTAMLLLVMSAAAWQELTAPHRTEPQQSVELASVLSAKQQVSDAAFQPEDHPHATPYAVMSSPGISLPAKINSPTSIQKNALNQPQILKGTVQMEAKPVMLNPLMPGKPQIEPLAPQNALKSQTNNQLPAKPLPPNQSVVINVELPAAQHSANSKESVSPLVNPLLKAAVTE